MTGEIEKRDLWADNPTRPSDVYGVGVNDLDKRSLWCQAYFYAGSTLGLWNEAVELKMALLTSCSISEGQNIILIAKYGEESGFSPALVSLVGTKDRMTIKEIGPAVLEAFRQIRNSGKWPSLDFNYFDSLPDKSIDRIIFFGVSSHVRDWVKCSEQTYRVLRPGGRIVIADAPWVGREMLTAAHLDAHLEGMLAKLLSGMKLHEDQLPVAGPDELKELFLPRLSWIRSFSWQGLYLFYGQKEGAKGDDTYEFPRVTIEVQKFLRQQPVKSPWGLLSRAEIEVLGPDIMDIDRRKRWGRTINIGGGFSRMEEYESIRKLMWDNLKSSPGFKALVIGEFIDYLWIPELKNRKGSDGEITGININLVHHEVLRKIYESGEENVKIPLAERRPRHQWDYDYADKYPDEYFDLIWFPQGVHHASDWGKIAPRMARVLKPGGQIMLVENRVNNPEFLAAMQISGQMRYIARKLYWAMNVPYEELPDYPAVVIEEAFKGLLSNTYSLEWKGWLLYWGFKK